jgi:hypothetical protein
VGSIFPSQSSVQKQYYSKQVDIIFKVLAQEGISDGEGEI